MGVVVVVVVLVVVNNYGEKTQATGYASQHYSVPVASQDKLGELRQKWHSV